MLGRAATLLAWAAVVGCGAPDIHHSHTNVVWVTVCSLRADRLGAYGHPGGLTPFLDGLAARGALFERALTQAPWTRPSMSSMVTGVYPRSLGIRAERGSWQVALPPDRPTLAERLSAAGYFTVGITANPYANPVYHFDRGFDVYRGTEQQWDEGYETDKRTAEEVVFTLMNLLRREGRGRRFFAHLVLIDVHIPYTDGPALRRTGYERPPGPTAAYDLQVRYVDAVLGDLARELEALDTGDILFVLNADHGEGFGETKPADRFHGDHLYNSVLWVPLVFHHPSLESAPVRVAERVESVDVVPTVLDLLDLPFDPAELDGQSLAPAILGRGEVPERDLSVVETRLARAPKSAVVRGSWKLIVDHRPEPPAVELYRFEEDPGERRNVAARHPDRVTGLLRRLARWQSERPPPSDPIKVRPSEDEVEALRGLGYVVD